MQLKCPGNGGQKQEVSASGYLNMREITAAESPKADSAPDMNPTCSSLKPLEQCWTGMSQVSSVEPLGLYGSPGGCELAFIAVGYPFDNGFQSRFLITL